MKLHCALTNAKNLCDLTIGKALGYSSQAFMLAASQPNVSCLIVAVKEQKIDKSAMAS